MMESISDDDSSSTLEISSSHVVSLKLGEDCGLDTDSASLSATLEISYLPLVL